MYKVILLTLSLTPISAAAQTALEVSTLGIGASYEIELSENLSVSISANRFDGNFQSIAIIDSADIDLDLTWQSLGVAAKISIPDTNLYTTIGFRLKEDAIQLSGHPKGYFNAFGTILPAKDYATLHGTAQFNKIAPTIALGYEREFAKEWSINSSIGAMFQGRPKVNLVASGPLAAFPEFNQQVERDRLEIEEKLSALSVYPVLSFSISYRF